MVAPAAEAARAAPAPARVAVATAVVRPVVASVHAATTILMVRVVRAATTTPMARIVRAAPMIRMAVAIPDAVGMPTGGVLRVTRTRTGAPVPDAVVTLGVGGPGGTTSQSRVGGGVRRPGTATGMQAVAVNEALAAVVTPARVTSGVRPAVRPGTDHSRPGEATTDARAPAGRRPVVPPVPTRAIVAAPAASVAMRAGAATRRSRTVGGPVAVALSGATVTVRAATVARVVAMIDSASSAVIAVPISEVAGPRRADAPSATRVAATASVMGTVHGAVTSVASGVRSRNGSRCIRGSSRVPTNRRRPRKSTSTCCRGA